MLRVFSSSDAVRSGGVSAHERVGTGAAGCRISDVGSKVKARSMIGSNMVIAAIVRWYPPMRFW